MYENTISEILKAQTDKEELGKIVENNSGLVWSIVKRFKGRGYENEDLFQIGNIGLIKAIKNFNPEYEVKLSTYAVTYIIGEIKKFIRDDGIIKVSRSIKELCVKIKDIENKAIKEGKNVTVEEIAKELKVEKEDIVLAIDSMKQVDSIYEEDSENNKSTSSISSDAKIADKSISQPISPAITISASATAKPPFETSWTAVIAFLSSQSINSKIVLPLATSSSTLTLGALPSSIPWTALWYSEPSTSSKVSPIKRILSPAFLKSIVLMFLIFSTPITPTAGVGLILIPSVSL